MVSTCNHLAVRPMALGCVHSMTHCNSRVALWARVSMQPEEAQSKSRIPHGDSLLTPEDVSRLLKVTAEQVRSLIRKGRLKAVNIGAGAKRPLYRVTSEALEEFLAPKSSPAARQVNRFRRPPPVRDHFPDLR